MLVVSNNLRVVRKEKYLEIHPLVSYNCGILASTITSLFIIII